MRVRTRETAGKSVLEHIIQRKVLTYQIHRFDYFIASKYYSNL